MTHAELAKKIREAVYERATYEGGAISKEQMEDAIERALVKLMPVAPQPAYPAYAVCLTDMLIHGTGVMLVGGEGKDPTEWR